MITVAGVALASDPGPSGGGGGGGPARYLVGPFRATLADVGTAPDPVDSDPLQVRYDDAVALFPVRPGSVTGLSVRLTDDAAGSDVRVSIFTDDGPSDALVVTIEDGGDTGKGTCAVGAIPVADGGRIFVGAQVGIGWTGLTVDLVAVVEFTES